MRTNVVGLRASRLLKEPLRLSGESQPPDEDTLVRQVRVPYVETTTINTAAPGAGHATVARDGKSPRSPALSRVHQLARRPASVGPRLGGARAALAHPDDTHPKGPSPPR